MVATALRLVGGGRGTAVKAQYYSRYSDAVRYIPTVMLVDPDIVPPKVMVARQE